MCFPARPFLTRVPGAPRAGGGRSGHVPSSDPGCARVRRRPEHDTKETLLAAGASRCSARARRLSTAPRGPPLPAGPSQGGQSGDGPEPCLLLWPLCFLSVRRAPQASKGSSATSARRGPRVPEDFAPLLLGSANPRPAGHLSTILGSGWDEAGLRVTRGFDHKNHTASGVALDSPRHIPRRGHFTPRPPSGPQQR